MVSALVGSIMGVWGRGNELYYELIYSSTEDGWRRRSFQGDVVDQAGRHHIIFYEARSVA